MDLQFSQTRRDCLRRDNQDRTEFGEGNQNTKHLLSVLNWMPNASIQYDEGNVYTATLERLESRLIGSNGLALKELEIMGRSLNRPQPANGHPN